MFADIRTRLAACVLAFSLASLAPCAAWGAEGDGSSREGDVVAAADGASSHEVAPNSGSDVIDEAPSDEQEGPTALRADGNEINDGQVSDTSFLYDAAIADLAGADSYYDGQTVQVRGEAVGEAIRMTEGAGDSVWVTLVDTSSGSSVSVVMKRSDMEKIDMYGAYGKTGSRLRVQGIYNLACSEHDGESDIHAEVVTVEEKGFVEPDRFELQAFFPGIAAVAAGGLLMALFWYVRERSR